MSYVLRHAAGTPECPITEEGWVRWTDLTSHESCRKYGGWTLWSAIENDAKTVSLPRKTMTESGGLQLGQATPKRGWWVSRCGAKGRTPTSVSSWILHQALRVNPEKGVGAVFS